MQTTRILCMALPLVASCFTSGADTITLTHGGIVEGIVKDKGDGVLEVNAGGNVVFLRADEVAQIEKNDRDGTLNMDEVKAQVAEELARMEQETGLTLEQRERVDALLNQMQSGSPAEQLEARERLVKLNQEFSIVRYLEYWFRSLVSTALLEAIYYVAPAEAVDNLQYGVSYTNQECRSKAIDLLATMGHADSAELIARGLADHSIDVRLSAVYALAKLGVKKASTAFTELMAQPDIKVSNASQQALEALWAAELNGQPAPKSVTEWNDFLSKQGFGGGFSLGSLEPLITKEEEFIFG